MSAPAITSFDSSPELESPTAWRSQSWLAPRLVFLTLVAIALSVLAERAGSNATLILAVNAVAYAAGGFLWRQDRH